MADLTNIVFAALFLICWFFIIKRFIYSKYAPSKTVKAEVFDKYSRIPVSKYPGVFNQAEYIVVFKTKDKRLAFRVSENSYSSYKIKEKGTLKYKGQKLIDFSA